VSNCHSIRPLPGPGPEYRGREPRIHCNRAATPHTDDKPARKLWLGLLIVAVAVGGVCRVRQYLTRTSYWNDEAFVVLNIVDHPASWMLGPLDYNQAAPPAFMWVEQTAAHALGTGEYALRLFPLLSGVGALVLFAVLSWRVIPGPAAMFATGWFAAAEKLVSYSAELKQYSSDAVVAVLLMLVAIGGNRRGRASSRFLAVAAITAVAVWLSHPAVIVFAALSLGLALACWRQGWSGRAKWIAGNLLVLASFAALYRISIVREQDPFLYRFWADGFPPLGRPLDVPGWLFSQLYGLVRQPFTTLKALTGALAIVGLVDLVRQRRALLLTACVAPVVLTILAAFAGKYPFYPSRLTMFLLPGLLLLCGAGARLLMAPDDARLRWAGAVLPIGLLGFGLTTAAGRLVHPHFNSHIRPVVEYVRAHRKPGEALYLLGQPNSDPQTPWGRHMEFLCYWRNPDPPRAMTLPTADRLPARFWIVYPFTPGHPTDFIKPALDKANSNAGRVDYFLDKHGGAAYLFAR